MNSSKKFLIMSFLVSLISLYSVALEPILAKGKSWERALVKVNMLDGSYSIGSIGTIAVDGDTIINGKKCFFLSLSESTSKATDTRYIVREENGRLFYLVQYGFSNDYVELPLIDLSYDAGDEIPYFDNLTGTQGDAGNPNFVVTSVQTINVNGIDRKELCLDHYGMTICWVEGIGATSNIYMTEIFSYSNYYYDSAIIAVYQDGECIFRQDDFSHPSPYASASEISSNETDTNIYDLRGLKVKHPQAGNVYIKNGEKFLAD